MFAPTTLEGRVGLVTGAGSPYGIGRSLVVELARAGAKAVYACDLNQSNFPSLAKQIKDLGLKCEIHGKFLDVSSEEQTVALLRTILKEQGRFDFYFANAGYANFRHLDDLSVDNYDKSTAVMGRSVFLAIKYGSKAMAVTSAEKPKSSGSIIATSSVAAYLGAYADLSYTSAKNSVNGLVEGGSVMLSASGIRVNGMAPGFTQSSILTSSKEAEKGSQYDVQASEKDIKATHQQFFDQAGLSDAIDYYYNRTAVPEELARVGVFLASDLSSSVNGITLLADSGKTAAATGEACTGPVPAIVPLSLEEPGQAEDGVDASTALPLRKPNKL